MPVKPRIFIASSAEGKSIADALEIALQADAHCTAWHNAFPLSNNTLDTLLKRCAENDFAIFIFSPDDRLSFRAASFEIARDNVLFESGLFMGMHGKERGFIIVPQDNPKFHMPTDFSGFTTASYDHERAKKEARPALGAASALIRESLRNWSSQRLEIKPFAKFEPPPKPGEDPATFELKLRFDIRNPSGFAVAIESQGFAFEGDLRASPLAHLRPGDRYPFEFWIGRQNQKDKYVPKCVIESGHSVASWIPIDPQFGLNELEKRINARKSGILHYRVTWLSVPPIAQTFEDEI